MKNRFKRVVHIAAALLLIGGLYGCSSNKVGNLKEQPAVKVEEKITEEKKRFTNITAEEAKKRLDSGVEAILLDVRTKEEYAEGHIKDSVLIPVDVLQKEAEASLKDKNAAIFVYCRSGNRSSAAANILIELGYTNVYDLGGIRDWPYEIEK
jgi:Rhodanese-related sulfurtransferase